MYLVILNVCLTSWLIDKVLMINYLGFSFLSSMTSCHCNDCDRIPLATKTLKMDA